MNHYDFFEPPEYTDRYMCSIAAAILGAGALSAGATAWGANRASSAQTAAGQAAIGAQREMFGTAKNALDPFINAGTGGIGDLQKWLSTAGGEGEGPLNALMKLTMPGANMSETLAQTPGYQFTEDRGLRAVNNALAARGLGGSPGAITKGAGEYVTGLASGTWQNVVNSLMNLFTGGAGAKQNFVNTGAGAAGTLTGAATNVGGQIGGNLVGIGNAQGGAATATGNAIGNFGNSVSSAALLQKLLGGGFGGGGGNSTGLYGGSPETNPLLNPSSFGNSSAAAWG